MRISRRRRFALPLVLVVGCGAPKTGTTPTTSIETGGESPTATETDLPPAPGSGAVTKSTDGGVTVLTYESGDRVYVREDGTCFAEYSANCKGSDKPEITTCNPPPPQQVKCPTDAK